MRSRVRDPYARFCGKSEGESPPLTRLRALRKGKRPKSAVSAKVAQPQSVADLA